MDVKDLISDYLVVFVAQIAAGKVEDEMLYDLGKKAGTFTTTKCKTQLGNNWNKLEDVLQTKVDNFMAGFYDGLNSDDQGMAA